MLIYALNGVARTHYMHNVSQCKDFTDAKDMMRRNNSCTARQLQVVPVLEQLRFRRFMADKGYSAPACGLKELVEIIESLITLTPTAYQFEAHKTSLLKKAVVDQCCAKEAVTNISALYFGFNEFVTALHDCIQRDQEITTANLKVMQKHFLITLNQNETRITPRMRKIMMHWKHCLVIFENTQST